MTLGVSTNADLREAVSDLIQSCQQRKRVRVVAGVGCVPTDDEDVIDTTNRGEPIVLRPESRLAAIYDKIARRLEGEIVPFTTLSAPNFLSRLLGRKAG